MTFEKCVARKTLKAELADEQARETDSTRAHTIP